MGALIRSSGRAMTTIPWKPILRGTFRGTLVTMKWTGIGAWLLFRFSAIAILIVLSMIVAAIQVLVKETGKDRELW